MLTHEVGHVLGLVHSADPGALMSPYYVADRVALTASDVAAVEALYGGGAGGGDGGDGGQERL